MTRVRLGLYFQELTPKLASALGAKATTGAIVTNVVPDGPAAKAGLPKEDGIVALNGKEMDGRSLRLAVGSMAPGMTINLKVLRNGSERQYPVTLDAASPRTRAKKLPISEVRISGTNFKRTRRLKTLSFSKQDSSNQTQTATSS